MSEHMESYVVCGKLRGSHRVAGENMPYMDHGYAVWERTLLALQLFHVLFLWLHDWMPLGRLNDIVAIRQVQTRMQMVVTTLVQSIPYTLGLLFTALHAGNRLPGWVSSWLWISYGLLFLGELRAWWVPYLFRADPARAARYQRMFGHTHAFLPKRHGMVPNTLHVVLHVATVATLVVLLLVP
jgi:hypothetical protein